MSLQHHLLSTEQQLKALSSELTSKREEESEARDKLHTCQQELEALREELLNQVPRQTSDESFLLHFTYRQHLV